ncbi:MAG: transporter substrate-binding domain-containing protein [Chloroflexi bacterium]|nr:transporter substrate-binding domain-containing protein [Chloroflexota bacterium]
MAAAARRRLKLASAARSAILAFAIAGALAIVVLSRRSAPPDVKSAFPAGEIVIGVDASFPPFALDNGERIEGLDIDLASALARELELPIRFENIGFYALHDALISGRVDMLVSALRVDPARMDDLRYTQSYFDNGLVVVGTRDTAQADAEAPAKARIAFEYASSADAEIRAWEVDGQWITMLPYELPEFALDAARLGLADGAVVDATTLRLYLRARSEWTPRYEYITHEPYAIALRIDRAEAWRLVDGALDALKESGELVTIIDSWL